MRFTKEELREFSRLWQEAFGETLSDDQAKYHAERLMMFFLLLAKTKSQKNEVRADTSTT